MGDIPTSLLFDHVAPAVYRADPAATPQTIVEAALKTARKSRSKRIAALSDADLLAAMLPIVEAVKRL
jgi:hypothetical protein